MRMPYHLSRTLLVLALLAASGDACSPSARNGRPTTSPAPPTPVPADLKITVPKGDIEEIHGIVGHSEWAHAQRADFVPEGELLLMHDGQYLHLDLCSKPDSVGSVCITRGNQILVLHPSLGVGTAAYEFNEGSWQRTQDFRWIWWDENDGQLASNQKADFL
jgi:hypothetical protein